MKLKKILTLLQICICIGFAETIEESQQKDYRNSFPITPATVQKTYKDATNSQKTKDWNAKDWESNMQKNGVLDAGLIGNSQRNAETKGSSIVQNINPNELSTQSLRENESLKDNKALQGYSTKVEKSVIEGNNKRSTGVINTTQTTKCYIAREMPIRFKCSRTGLIYGAGMDTGGAEAQKKCETECYEQFACVNVTPSSSIVNLVNIDNLKVTGNKDKKTIEKILSVTQKTDFVELSGENIKERVFFDIIITSKENEDLVINRKVLLKNEYMKMSINQYAKKIKIIAYGDSEKSEGELRSIIVNSKKEEKFICPSSQDISNKQAGDFAFICPSGKIKTVSNSTGSYKICEDYGVVGDNSDGTFSNESACNNSCKSSFACSIDNNALSSNSLQNFREGCIEGQSDCNIDTCRNLRIQNGEVITENVFHGNFIPEPTVVNGALVNGADRPRVLFSEDLDFEERKKEEWKDSAYGNMAKRGTYRYTDKKLNEDTVESNAFSMGIKSNSISSTESGSALKTLYWAFKPRAFDVNNESFKYYAVLEAIVDRIKVDEYGQKYRDKDKILYVKTNENDFFKPFAIKKSFSRKNSNQFDDAEKIGAFWEYKYFNTSSNSWFSHSASTPLEYFANKKIELKGPFLRIPIVENYNGLMYSLPGIERSSLASNNQIVSYSGAFDGTGQAITILKVYVDYSKTSSLTYEDVVKKIENKEWEPIYNNSSTGSSKTAVTSDTKIDTDSVAYMRVENKGSKEDIEIFVYGNEKNKSGYTRIKPRTEDIGKKGFIFIFAQ